MQTKIFLLLLIPLIFLVACNKEKAPPVQVNATNQSNATAVVVKVLPDTDFKLIVPKLDKGIMAVIKYKDSIAIIDGGGQGSPKQAIALLDASNTTLLRYVFVSNNKFYRSFGLPYLFLKYDAQEFHDNGLLSDDVYASKQSEPLSTDQEFLMGKVSIKAFVPYDEGKGYSLEPVDNTIVYFVQYNKTRILYLSDCGKTCQERIGTLPQTDILITPLCAESLSANTLKAIRPSLVIVTNNGNYDACPSQEILDMLDMINIKVLKVDDGDVTVVSDGQTIYI
jgi:hypothetical protein